MKPALLLLLALVVGPRSLASAQADSAPNAPSRDTIPANVLQRGVEAFNRHDARALGALYAPTAAFLSLTTDSSARPRPGNPDSTAARFGRYWASQKQPPTLTLLRRVSAGPYVVDEYRLVDDEGPSHFLELYEVRGGLIIHDWILPSR